MFPFKLYQNSVLVADDSATHAELCNSWKIHAHVQQMLTSWNDVMLRRNSVDSKVVTSMFTVKMTLLIFPWIDFNAVSIVTTATNTCNSTCLSILVEIGCGMTILQQVEVVLIFMPYFRSIATHTVCGYHTNMKLVSRGFQCVSAKYE